MAINSILKKTKLVSEPVQILAQYTHRQKTIDSSKTSEDVAVALKKADSIPAEKSQAHNKLEALISETKDVDERTMPEIFEAMHNKILEELRTIALNWKTNIQFKTTLKAVSAASRSLSARSHPPEYIYIDSKYAFIPQAVENKLEFALNKCIIQMRQKFFSFIKNRLSVPMKIHLGCASQQARLLMV
uniref:Uncharacterized protein n=1 Tax=Ditylenchus dipsaci TaxID=166011 RepID=A0A915DR27_9BILA